ncbi:hypothetical protein [Bacillus sp. V5-8f]|uniref:hypothetical protein n=1 Tax=Bacillus sp. V5-8f TaxID=2053044 RepID=UPI000C76A688|nr:hypothetical protein [Bacillus sp. V5-8f]PLT33106.1 hypothetical protein CUU64_15075 [Bacillus sp. V5-8f]
MNLLDSKVIHTKFETEIFIDESESIELRSVHFPKKDLRYYECMIGLDLIRIRDNKFYGWEKNYFGIRITSDMQSIAIFEPHQQSIFAVKNEQETQGTKELVDYVLTESHTFKKMITKRIEQLRQTNVVTEDDIKEVRGRLELLEKLRDIRHEDIE